MKKLNIRHFFWFFFKKDDSFFCILTPPPSPFANSKFAFWRKSIMEMFLEMSNRPWKCWNSSSFHKVVLQIEKIHNFTQNSCIFVKNSFKIHFFPPIYYLRWIKKWKKCYKSWKSRFTDLFKKNWGWIFGEKSSEKSLAFQQKVIKLYFEIRDLSFSFLWLEIQKNNFFFQVSKKL